MEWLILINPQPELVALYMRKLQKDWLLSLLALSQHTDLRHILE